MSLDDLATAGLLLVKLGKQRNKIKADPCRLTSVEEAFLELTSTAGYHYSRLALVARMIDLDRTERDKDEP